MSRLLVNSVANFGKLMRNVGTKNYSTECSPTLDRLNDHLDKVQESRMSKLKTIGDFNIVSMNKETKIVKLVKDIPNMKMKIMFDMDMPCIGLDKKKFWSKVELVEKRLKLQKCGDVKFYSENDKSLMKGMTGEDSFIVELDKGQSNNFVVDMLHDKEDNELYVEAFGLMSKHDQEVKCLTGNTNNIQYYLNNVLDEYGLNSGIFEKLKEWQNEWSSADFEQTEKLRNFFAS